MSMLSRRGFASAFAAMGAAITLKGQDPTPVRDYGPNASPVRYPEPDVVVLDPEFAKYKVGNSPIKRVHTGDLWAEGIAWNGVGKYVMWSDIPNNVQRRYLLDDGHISTFRNPAGYSNGNTFDQEGRQISCEHGNRRVVRYEYNGKTTVLADTFGGKKLNAPNDVVVSPDGAVWFTDPGYGSLGDYEGNKGPLELKEAVYRIDSKSGKVTKVTDELFKPNGLCFSPDFKLLYIADTGASHYKEAPRNIKVFDVDGGKLSNGREFISMEMELGGKKVAGFADGIRADTDGNVWVGAGWVGPGYDGVHIFNPQGKRIGLIKLPEICGNLCFGGLKRNILFMAASQSVYRVLTEAKGAGYA